MSDYLAVAEIYAMQHRLIEMFGGLHGVRQALLRPPVFVRKPDTTTPSRRKQRP